MYSRLYKHLSRNNVLYDFQFGFRKNHSTALMLFEVTDSIYQNLDEGSSCCGIHLDLQKAFDTVNHDILLSKLYKYGVHHRFQSYLANRKQYTCVAGVKSDSLSVSCGGPQGSVLRPLLSSIYVNDIRNAVPNEKVKLLLMILICLYLKIALLH
jgi:retron-type reverse transcriptase